MSFLPNKSLRITNNKLELFYLYIVMKVTQGIEDSFLPKILFAIVRD